MGEIDFSVAIQVLANVGVMAGMFLLVYQLRQGMLVTKLAAATNYSATVRRLRGT